MNHKFEKLLNQLVKLHPKYIDLSLERILNLLNKIDDPHLRLPPVIHIAGTNGKGSTLSFIHHILQENHYSVHCYISPHLKSFEEISVGEVRDMFNTSRKYALALMEYLDAQQITKRIGDKRVLF